MNRHRTAPLPDWTYVTPADRNWWQRISAATLGVATPGNVISVVGFALVCVGVEAIVQHSFIFGLLSIGIGRLCDLFDGMVANKTGTKSPLGEAVDATLDKIAILVCIIAFGIVGMVPWLVLCALAVQNFVNAGASYMAVRDNITLHPSTTGKKATAWQWFGVISFIVVNIIPAAIWPAYLCTTIGLGLGVIASWQYVQKIVK